MTSREWRRLQCFPKKHFSGLRFPQTHCGKHWSVFIPGISFLFQIHTQHSTCFCASIVYSRNTSSLSPVRTHAVKKMWSPPCPETYLCLHLPRASERWGPCAVSTGPKVSWRAVARLEARHGRPVSSCSVGITPVPTSQAGLEDGDHAHWVPDVNRDSDHLVNLGREEIVCPKWNANLAKFSQKLLIKLLFWEWKKQMLFHFNIFWISIKWCLLLF